MSSACYEPASLNMSVKNPFMQEAVFKIILLEMPEGPSEAEKEAEAARRKKQQQHKKGKKEEDPIKPPDPGFEF